VHQFYTLLFDELEGLEFNDVDIGASIPT
jgi:hypothetical protein